MSTSAPSSSIRRDIVKVEGTRARPQTDSLAVEEPLEIRLAWRAHDRDGDGEGQRAAMPLFDEPPRNEKTLAITMRTPGHDLELAVGFLVGEGLLRRPGELASSRHCGPAAREDGTSNIVRLELASAGDRPVDLARLERNFYTSSSCGVCGKTSLEAVHSAPHDPLPPPAEGPLVPAQVVHGLATALRHAQDVFDRTGGLHAAGLFDERGELLALREDVGRHNAVDKVVGARFLAAPGEPLKRASLLLVSGRASFELAQKAVMATLPILAAVGAPSSLAIELALAEGLTVLGFVRDGRFNVYSGASRIAEVAP